MPCSFHRHLQHTAGGQSISNLATLPAKSTSALCNMHSSTHHSNLPTKQLRWGTLTPNSAAEGQISHTYIDRPWHLLPLLCDKLCDHPGARRQWPTQLVITSAELAAQTHAHSSTFCPASQFHTPMFARSTCLMHRRKQGGRSSIAGESAEGPFQGQVSIKVSENLRDTMEGKQRDSVRVPESR